MIILFTDFGLEGPYIGQVKAVLHARAPGVPIIDLFADAPTHDPQASAYLLAAYAEAFPAGSVFLAVVDPGVGSTRACVAVEAGGRWFVGPDNGLFEIAARRVEALGGGGRVAWWVAESLPDGVSASFHGRDVFAPMAAVVARSGGPDPAWRRDDDAPSHRRPEWPDDLARIVYIDHFGNAMSGLRAAPMGPKDEISIGEKTLRRTRTFSDVSPGTAFWYENSNGLVEIAVNTGRAADRMGIKIGDDVTVKRIAE